MSWISKILGEPISAPVEALGTAIDKVFTSDEERLQARAVLAELAMRPAVLAAELAKVELGHRSMFVAGWRPAVGWVCVLGLIYRYLAWPFLTSRGLELPPPDPAMDELLYALLGIAGLRSFEKFTGRSK